MGRPQEVDDYRKDHTPDADSSSSATTATSATATATSIFYIGTFLSSAPAHTDRVR